MRRNTLLACLFLSLYATIPFLAGAQTYTGDVLLTTQTEVDAFDSGGTPYTEVAGSLTIQATGTITDLSNLSALTTVTGSLSLTDWGADDTAGAGNPLGGLTSLTSVGNLQIGSGDPATVTGLQSVSLPALTTVSGNLLMQQVPNLATASFPALTQTGGDFNLTHLPQLDYFDGPLLATIGGQMRLNELDDLVNLDNLPAVASIGSSLIIRGNDNLTTLDGLSAGVSGGANFTLTELVVEFNQVLTSIAGISATISDVLTITDNSTLSNVGRDLTLVTGMNSITINDNASLTNISRIFDGTGAIEVADISIAGNNKLRITGGQELNVTNSLVYSNNPQVSLLLNFEGTTALASALQIVGNSSLTETHPLRNLTTVTGGVTIQNNDALTPTSAIVDTQPVSGLTGFQSLERAAFLTFDGNDGMDNLDDFASLVVLDNALQITNNGVLGDCCQLPCQVAVDGAAFDTYNPAVAVSSNSGNCADKAAIRNNCVSAGCAAAAPVRWADFRLEETPRGVQLNWTTTTETNNAYFTVERSADGNTFSAIGAVAGAGTTRSPRNYAFIDERPLPGRQFYRLRQVDADGTFEYSPVRSILAEAGRGAVKVFPNPVARGSVVSGAVDSGQCRSLNVYSGRGRLVRRVTVSPSGNWRLQTGELPAGLYTLRLAGADAADWTRLLVR
ncbi:hypothetical protein GGR26_001240 [Lewinella marina]|uniref:Secretion system C-terminal sorting domain-containing protein n=1 Tax=Neolewinella marina TaxID=438751 RepID=A0A2G0CFR1_9BACT|nr:T9SS type A sorting domain-containing protein [Neolewinella marina]NJB85495.1 hypothetical protein [Neolewinella marina]PHK98816.1 hypothetical protein CGL56_10155 [Neolewinella marina]